MEPNDEITIGIVESSLKKLQIFQLVLMSSTSNSKFCIAELLPTIQLIDMGVKTDYKVTYCNMTKVTIVHDFMECQYVPIYGNR